MLYLERRVMVILDDVKRRALLTHAIEDTVDRVCVCKARSLCEAEGKLLGDPGFEALFISGEFGLEAVVRFIGTARKLSSAMNSTFVLVLREQLGTDMIAKHLLVGINAFLVEPYSGEAIQEVLALGNRVLQGGSVPRLKVATGMMLNEMLNSYVYMRKAEEADDGLRKVDSVWKDVRHVCEGFKQVTGESLTTVVVSALANITPMERMLRCERFIAGLLRMLKGSVGSVKART